MYSWYRSATITIRLTHSSSTVVNTHQRSSVVSRSGQHELSSSVDVTVHELKKWCIGVVNMKKQVAKSEVRFDTQKAFAGMGAAVELLMRAAPNVLEHKVSGPEKQGKARMRKAAA